MKLLDGDHHYIMSLFWFSSYKMEILSFHTVWKVSMFGDFPVRIFTYSDWILYLSVLNPNAGIYGPEKLRIRTLFRQCQLPFCHPHHLNINQPAIDFFEVSGGKTRIMCKIFSQLAINRACSLVVSDLRSETKGSRFESGCQLCAEVNSLQ